MRSKISSVAVLAPDAEEAVEQLHYSVRHLAAGHEVVREGDRSSSCCLLVEGFMQRSLVASNGERQIVSLHTPGDIPDLQSLHLKKMDHTLSAIGHCTAAFIAHQDLRNAIRKAPSLGDILWRETLVDGAIFRRWIVELGRQNAPNHMAHLFCELFLRLQSVGLTQGNSCELPLTQATLGDALGLSTVHTNRSLQALRRSGFVEFDGGRLTILDWDALAELADFDPLYLHFSDPVFERMWPAEGRPSK